MSWSPTARSSRRSCCPSRARRRTPSQRACPGPALFERAGQERRLPRQDARPLPEGKEAPCPGDEHARNLSCSRDEPRSREALRSCRRLSRTPSPSATSEHARPLYAIPRQTLGGGLPRRDAALERDKGTGLPWIPRTRSAMGEAEETRAGSLDPGQVRGFNAEEDLEELQKIVGQALSATVLPKAGVDDGGRSRGTPLR